MKVPVNKGTLLSELRVATVLKCKSSVKGVWVEVRGASLLFFILTEEGCRVK